MDVFSSQLFFSLLSHCYTPVSAPISTLWATYCPQTSSERWPRMGKPSKHFKHHEFCTSAHTHSLTHAHTDTTLLCTCTHGDKCAPNTHTLELSESDICVWERCFDVLLGGLESSFEGAAGRLVLLHARFLKGPLRSSMPSGAIYQGLPTISHIKALKEAQQLDYMSHTFISYMYYCICSSYYPETIL